MPVPFPIISCRNSQPLNLQTFCSRVYENKIFKINIRMDVRCYYLSNDIFVVPSLQFLLSVHQFSCFLFFPHCLLQQLCLLVSVSLCWCWICYIVAAGRRKFLTIVHRCPLWVQYNTSNTIQHLTPHCPSPLFPPLLFYCLSAKSINKIKSFVEVWWWEYESLQRVEWVYDQHKSDNKPWQPSCISSVNIYSFLSFPLSPLSLSFAFCCRSQQNACRPQALNFFVYILTHLQMSINQCRNGASGNYSTKSGKNL